MSYCQVSDVKSRHAIDTANTTYDGDITQAITEASEMVNIFLEPFTTVPLTSVPLAIRFITADFAASIFKRRYIPDEVTVRNSMEVTNINEHDGSGYYAMGLSKLQRYIQNHYGYKQPLASITNQETVDKLFARGIITLDQARMLMNNGFTDTVNKASTVNNNLTETLNTNKTLQSNNNLQTTSNTNQTLTDTITKKKDDTLTEKQYTTKEIIIDRYETKRQCAFGGVAGNPNRPEGYVKVEDRKWLEMQGYKRRVMPEYDDSQPPIILPPEPETVYQLNYTLNNATLLGGVPSTYTASSLPIYLPQFTRLGYTAIGWRMVNYADGTYVDLVNGVIPVGTSGDRTLNARFNTTPDIWNITYELNGGTNGAGNPLTYHVLVSLPFSLQAPNKAGNQFVHWLLIKDDGSVSVVTNQFPVGTTGHVVLVAVWQPINP